jgi:hypothetical protein
LAWNNFVYVYRNGLSAVIEASHTSTQNLSLSHIGLGFMHIQRYDDQWKSFGLAILNQEIRVNLSCRSKCQELLLSGI